MRKVGGFSAFEHEGTEQHPSLTMELMDATRHGANIDERLSKSDSRVNQNRMRAKTDEGRATQSAKHSRKVIQDERARSQDAINAAIMHSSTIGGNIIACTDDNALFSLGLCDTHKSRKSKAHKRINGGGTSLAETARMAHLHEQHAISHERTMRKKEVSARANADYIIDLVRSKFETAQE
jgi:hypothetical protein